MLVISAAFYFNWQKVPQIETKNLVVGSLEEYCPMGKKMSLVLNDGTKVKSTADNYIRYSERHEDSIRKVELIGEAFFEVAKDHECPFIIESRYLQTSVLGTSFNVQAYPFSKELNVAVVEGLVQVSASEKNQDIDSTEFFLTKGEKVSYNTNENIWEKDIVPVEYVGRWKNQELVFEQEDVIGISHKLERWYGVKVIVRCPFLRKLSFSGTHIFNTLYGVLEGIAYFTNLYYSLQEIPYILNLKS